MRPETKLIAIWSLLCVSIWMNFVESVFSELMESATNDCRTALKEFANNTAVFTHCAIMSARPITLCETCAKNYIYVQVAYDKILKLEDDSGMPCRKSLINVDRLEILETGYSNVEDLWQNGHCESCLEIVNGTMTDTLRNETTVFLQYSKLVAKCFEDHYQNGSYDKTACRDCKDQYDEMNNFYQQLITTQGEGNVCVDIVDSVNTTQTKWSEILHCDRKEIKIEVGLVVALVVVSLLPIAFYTSTKHLTSHSETRISQQKRLVQTSVNSPSTSR